MVDQVPVRVRQEGIAVAVQLDARHLLRHRAVVDLDADHAHKLPPVVDRYVVGDHPHVVQAVRQIGGQPDAVPRGFRHRKPNQLARVVRVVLRDVRRFVLDEVGPVQVREPEALHLPADLRVDPVVVGQHAVGFPGDLVKICLHPLGMGLQLFVLQPVQILLRIGGHLLHGLFHAREVVIEVPLPRLTQQQKQLVAFPAFRILDEQDACQRDNRHSHHRDAQGQQRDLGSQRAHPSSSFPVSCIF